MLATLLGLQLALAAQAIPDEPASVPPYKTEKSWTFFRNDRNGNCTAGSTQPSGREILMMAYDAEQKAVSISFTSSRAPGLKDGSQRMLDIRLHRPSGVVDDGWEGVRFAVFNGPDDHVLFVSELMDLPATRDFGETESVVFIDRGRTAGSFRMRDSQFAVKEMIRCAEAIRATK